MQDWKERAKALFLVEKVNISQIADVVGVTRQTVSKHIKSLPEYEDEVARRKKQSRIDRVAYKNAWQRNKRNTISHEITGDTLRREHEQAVIELSREKYH
ncbi:MAG: helix-turn-helix domain-containing protein [Lachnospiraceae bacterium]|nr:helix-turn-helix domain-containing protein [Lachnospiraceae bacterium]